jgi:hypothetical protein
MSSVVSHFVTLFSPFDNPPITFRGRNVFPGNYQHQLDRGQEHFVLEQRSEKVASRSV